MDDFLWRTEWRALTPPLRSLVPSGGLLDNAGVSENPIIEIVVNGEGYRIAVGAKIPDLVRELALPPERLAIELNRDILPRGRWAETELQPGDALEIVHFVGGG